MTRILFWNVNKKALATEIAQVCYAHGVDLLGLAETEIEDGVLLGSLFSTTGRLFTPVPLAFRIRVYSALPEGYASAISDGGGLVLLHVRQVIGPQLLVAFAHLSSKFATDPSGVYMLATRMRPAIEEAERTAGHARTIVMGDLNMDPFDTGVISSEAFHATMSREIASRRERVVHGELRQFFYNPMWNFLGDGTRGPPGTYYRDKSEPNSYYWHMVDQVLLRPAAMDLVAADAISILTTAGDLHLGDGRGRPLLSDHFPILVETTSPVTEHNTILEHSHDR